MDYLQAKEDPYTQYYLAGAHPGVVDSGDSVVFDYSVGICHAFWNH